MHDDPTVQSIVCNHMNKCDAAVAAGVVQCLIPACKKELQRDMRLSARDSGYIAGKMKAWVYLFCIGPPSRGYWNPSFSTTSHHSC